MEGARFVLTASGTGAAGEQDFLLPVPCDSQLMELTLVSSGLGGAWAAVSVGKVEAGESVLSSYFAEESMQVTAERQPLTLEWPDFDAPAERRFHRGDMLDVHVEVDAPGNNVTLVACFLEG